MSLLRLDSATALKRFFHLERLVTVACGAWVPVATRLDAKTTLARIAWESSLIAESLRQRIFELRYPERSLDVKEDDPLFETFGSALHAPSPRAFLSALGEVLVPAQRAAYVAYLESSDDIADGPTFHFLPHAIEEKSLQEEAAKAASGDEPGGPAEEWIRDLGTAIGRWSHRPLDALPRVPDPLPRHEISSPHRRYEIPDDPGRDPRYFPCSFYWPDNFDPDYPYGEGLRLKVRSAVSHVNEVWAVDTAGAILYGYADSLGWEFTLDAARWLYDESRHMTMGERRLRAWGIPDAEVPLGKYIYEAAAGKGPLHRLGMLAYFETKNIGKKVERAEEFGRIGDDVSQRDMEFDWADEAIHAGYGRTWLRRAVEVEGRDPNSWADVVKECEELVAARVARATDEERKTIYEQAERLMDLAEKGAE